MLKLDDVKSILLNNGISFAENATIFGTLKPSVGAYKNGIYTAMESNNEQVLHFNKEGVAFIGINELNASIIPGELLFLPDSEIKQIKVKLGLLRYKFIIDTPKGEIMYGVNRDMPGYAWHKENLSFLLLRGTENNLRNINDPSA